MFESVDGSNCVYKLRDLWLLSDRHEFNSNKPSGEKGNWIKRAGCRFRDITPHVTFSCQVVGKQAGGDPATPLDCTSWAVGAATGDGSGTVASPGSNDSIKTTPLGAWYVNWVCVSCVILIIAIHLQPQPLAKTWIVCTQSWTQLKRRCWSSCLHALCPCTTRVCISIIIRDIHTFKLDAEHLAYTGTGDRLFFCFSF